MNKRLLRILLLLLAVTVVAVLVVRLVPREKKTESAVIPHIGQIQVLNACNGKGAAWETSEYLRSRGFDVVEMGNHDEWYFKHTIVACRNGNMAMARDVAAALNTDRVLLLRREGLLLDVTVFVGKDYPARLKGNS